MVGMRSSRRRRIGEGTRKLLATVLALGAGGCLFPEYTFEGASGGGGATTTTTTTMSTGGGAVGGGSGGGGGPPTEDCLSPGDEDGNGLADCADPACTPKVECVDPIPVGWGALGYVAMHRGSLLSDPACPGGTNGEVYSGFDGLDAVETCTPCGCDDPTDQPCALDPTDQDPNKMDLQLVRMNDKQCGSVADNYRTLTTPPGWDGACYADENFPGGQNCTGGACNNSLQIPLNAKVGAGTCNPHGGDPSTTTPTWTQAIKACDVGENLGGCTGGQTCVPKPAAPFDTRVCVAKAGEVTCPATYTDRSVAYGDFDDARDCTTCVCGGASGGTCKITVSVFGNTTCAGTAVGAVQSGQCSNLTGNPTVASLSAAVTTAPNGGSCNVTSGGVPTGGVTETSPTTFCCLPEN